MEQLLYIDPGTGSMLISILFGIMTTVFFVGKAALIKIKFFFTGKKNAVLDASYKPVVIYNEGKQYFSLFHPIVLEAERRRMPLTYLTSMENDPNLEKKYDFVKCEYIGEGNRAYARLNMLSAGIVLMTTPSLDVFQLKRSKNVCRYFHLMHSVDITTYCVYGIDYFDSILVTGSVQEPEIRRLEKRRNLPAKECVSVGCVYLDELAKKTASLPEEKDRPFTVLVSPTWGKSGLLSLYGEKLLDPLAKTGWRIIVRPHPQSVKSEAEMIERLKNRYVENSNIEWDFSQDNIVSMKNSDIMVSDYSGIIFDYAFLFDKPLLCSIEDIDLRSFDAFHLDCKTWALSTTRKIGIPLVERDFVRIKEVIESAAESEEMEAAREKAGDEAWMHRGEAAVRVVDYISEKSAEIEAERRQNGKRGGNP